MENNQQESRVPLQLKGRGSHARPANPYAQWYEEPDWEHLEHDEEARERLQKIKTEYFPDQSKSIISQNNSPDISFRYSVNPYRGCAHGCAYCYARPTHEYLGLNAGLDFESKIFVKEKAPELFRDWLARDKWIPEPIAFSGVTDCYQPAEQDFRLTRGCLEVACEARQPITIVTKNALVVRDLDLLGEMAELNLIRVAVSVTSLDQSLTRVMEPRTSAPAARLRAIEALSEAGIPVIAMVAPIIPGLNDAEIPAILKSVKQAGAIRANYVLLRLPLTVRPVFLEWLERALPSKYSRVECYIRQVRNGNLSSSQFGERMRGTGQIATQVQQSFQVFCKKFGLNAELSPLATHHFLRPRPSKGQLRLF